MTVRKIHSGTQTAVIATEHELLNLDELGTFTFHVDASDMEAGDTVELRIYQMILTGGTSRVAYMQEFSDAQDADDMIKISVPISNELLEADALKFTLKQTAGVGRDFPWKVLGY